MTPNPRSGELAVALRSPSIQQAQPPCWKVRNSTTSWWLNQPIWKMLVKMGIFPKWGVKIKKYFKPPPRRTDWQHFTFFWGGKFKKPIFVAQELFLCSTPKYYLVRHRISIFFWKFTCFLIWIAALRSHSPPGLFDFQEGVPIKLHFWEGGQPNVL